MLTITLSFLALALTVLNALTMRVIRPKDAMTITDQVAILIPMRNEASNVQEVLTSALGQENLENFAVIVLNDNSQDDTAERLAEYADDRLVVRNGQELLEGWLGKIFASHQLAQFSQGEFLVFLDADVRLHPQAISAAISSMRRLKWDFISPYPREIAKSFAEILIQPLLQWSWMASIPLRLAEVFPNRSTTIANGQLFIVKRSAYEKMGGHESIKHEVLDDLELARGLIAAGFRGGVAEASQIAHCQMYHSLSQVRDGYTKSLWRAFGGIPGTIFAVTLLFWTGVIPIILALFGSPFGWIAFFAIWSSRIVTAIRTRGSTATAFLHPLSILFLLYLIGLSWYRKSRGQLRWRDRVVA
jgi:glycosyltransferase involved in cell wall biosynthesis